MTALEILFYFFSAMSLGSGLLVITTRNPVHSALFLVLTFVSMSGLWILLHAEFLALILVLVYVGAVMTLFLFVVMMLSMHGGVKRESFVRYLPISIFILLMIGGITIMTVAPADYGLMLPQTETVSNVAALGNVLYTDYVYPFEVSAVLLLTAIVAAISLTHRTPSGRKNQNPSQQINIRREDRMRLVDLKKNNSAEGDVT